MPLKLVTGNLNATTTSGGIDLINTPTGAVTLVDLITRDNSAISYSQIGQDLKMTGTVSSVNGNILIDPPANVTMSSGALISSGGGSIGMQATGNVVLANINAGSNGAVNLTAGGNVSSAPGYSGPNITGGIATINVGGNAVFNTSVQMLDATVAGGFTIYDASGTTFSSAPPQIAQIVSTITATSSSGNSSGSSSGNLDSSFLIPSYVTGGGMPNLPGGTSSGTIGGTVGTFGDSEISAITATGSSTDQNKDKSDNPDGSDSNNKNEKGSTDQNKSNGKPNAKPNKC